VVEAAGETVHPLGEKKRRPASPAIASSLATGSGIIIKMLQCETNSGQKCGKPSQNVGMSCRILQRFAAVRFRFGENRAPRQHYARDRRTTKEPAENGPASRPGFIANYCSSILAGFFDLRELEFHRRCAAEN
jgi:hypothetical protein